MYKGHKILAVVPARSGSKGVKNKNIRLLAGKPLIGYTIEQALESKYIDRCIVSTNSREFAKISAGFGAEILFIRPAGLSTDRASTIDVLLHAMDWMENKENFDFDILVLLHCTTPLRSAEDIDGCIRLLFSSGADNVFSVSQAHRNPYFNMVEIESTGQPRLVKKGRFVTRQSAPEVYDLNSSIYVWKKEALKKHKSIFTKKTRVFIMPKERSVDIDDEFDFLTAEAALKNQP